MKWNKILFRVIARLREEMRDLAFRMKMKEIFLTFSSHMWKGNFFFQFLILHVKREEICFNFPSHMKKKRIFIYEKQVKSSFREKKEEIFLNFPFYMWEGTFFFQFPIPHVERGEIFFNFPSRMWKGRRLSSYFPSQQLPWFYFILVENRVENLSFSVT